MSARSLLRRITVGVCAVVAACALLISVDSMVHVTQKRFNWTGQRWQLILRGGEVSIDNKPQRNFEVTEQTKGSEVHNRALWEAEHNRMLRQMNGNPDSPEYAAARAQMDAWEKVHGVAWPGLHAVPSSSLIDHRVNLLWIVLLAAVVLLPLRLSARPRSTGTPRNLMLGIRLIGLAACIAIAVVWIWSYRNPVFFCIYAPRSTYAVIVVKGKIWLGKPQVTDPAKLAATEAIADRVRNNDLQWLVGPDEYRQRPNGPLIVTLGITTEVRRDTPLEELSASPDEAETARAMLDALNDPDRFLAAHAFLADLFLRQGFRASSPTYYAQGLRIGRERYANSRYADLQVLLTPEQQAFKTTTEIPTPVIVGGQLPAITKKWHSAFDRWTQPHSLAWVTPLLLLPLSWIYSIWRRKRFGPHQCKACGYDLTGNVSGICPECGSAVKPTKDAVPVATV